VPPPPPERPERPPLPLEEMAGSLTQAAPSTATAARDQSREPNRNLEQLIGYLRRSCRDYTPVPENQKA
jgi:hypothetical protein